MQSEVETGRFEAFTDGVFAIALPIAEVGVSEEGASRTQRLAEQRPRYAAYAFWPPSSRSTAPRALFLSGVVLLSYLLPSEFAKGSIFANH